MEYKGLQVEKVLVKEIEECPNCKFGMALTRNGWILDARLCEDHREKLERGYREYCKRKLRGITGYVFDDIIIDEGMEIITKGE